MVVNRLARAASVLLVASACATAGSPAVLGTTDPSLWPDAGAAEAHRARDASVHRITVAEPIAPHFHAHHTEIVLVVEGSGTLTLGDEQRTVGAGDVIVIPERTVHAFVPQGGSRVRAVSIFVPPFCGRDRVWLEPR
jgi:mannose-6-phosphate isomerase-like protein (cupin superfamily)